MYHPGFSYSLNPLKKYNHFTESREASKPNEIKILEYIRLFTVENIEDDAPSYPTCSKTGPKT